ncbi:hypothetical protein [Streptomyces sp. NPDC002205]|uniref:hypothetical protein n=1 Tax=Streptomyces sp. NPDC002205 TaxID=3154411 RepID=UPI00331C6CC1
MNYHGMLVADDGRVDVGRLVHPRVESEVAFPLGRPLGAGAEAVAAVASALEVIDSRYEAFRFDLHEVVADNTSAAGYAAGPWREPVGLTDLAVLLEIDGPVVRTGSTEAILGHPPRALEPRRGSPSKRASPWNRAPPSSPAPPPRPYRWARGTASGDLGGRAALRRPAARWTTPLWRAARRAV